MQNEYHKPAHIRHFIVGRDKTGTIWAKRYTLICAGVLSDYPLWLFPLVTLGLDGVDEGSLL